MKNLFRPEKIFIIIAFIYGLALAILTPPYQIPDEPQHLYRALSITNSRIISLKINNNTGDYLPSDLNEIHEKYVPIIKNLDKKTSFTELKNNLTYKYDNTNLTFFNFPNTALYSPISYLPQIIAILFSKLLTNSLVAILLFGRIFSLFYYMAMGYFAIKNMPILKWGTLFVLLTPMNLIIVSGFSADTVLYGLAALYFSKIIQYSIGKQDLKNKNIIILSVLAFLISLTKQSFIFTLFILLIPKKVFKSNYLKKIALILLPGLIATIIWSLLIKNIYIPLNNSNVIEQLYYIFKNPIEYITVLFKPTYDSLIILYETICIMGWLEMSIPKYYYFLYIILFVLNSIIYPTQCIEYQITTQTKIKLILLCLINYVAISTILYLSWAPPGNFYPTMVLQGRYFSILLLPIMTTISILIPHIKSKNTYIMNTINVIFIICVLSQVTQTIYIRYY